MLLLNTEFYNSLLGKKYTDKALLPVFENDIEAWVPRSTIHNERDENESENFQDFLIDTWLLKKNKIDF